jgi:hypothetical protein
MQVKDRMKKDKDLIVNLIVSNGGVLLTYISQWNASTVRGDKNLTNKVLFEIRYTNRRIDKAL